MGNAGFRRLNPAYAGWGIDLNIDNVTNRRYYIATNVVGAFVGPPLSAYVRLHFDF